MKWMHRMMFRLMPDCRQTERLQSRSLDESLGLRDRLGVFSHVLVCTCCRRFGRQIAAIRRWCEELPEKGGFDSTPMPEECRERLAQRLREATATDDESGK